MNFSQILFRFQEVLQEKQAVFHHSYAVARAVEQEAKFRDFDPQSTLALDTQSVDQIDQDGSLPFHHSKLSIKGK
jgi:hypothetical protein